MGGRGGNDNAGPKEGSLGGIGVLLTGNNSVTNIGRIYGGNYGNAGSDGDTIIVAPAIVAGGDGNKIVNAGGLHSGKGNAVQISGSNNHFEIQDGSVIAGAIVVDGVRNKLVLGGDYDYFFDVSKLGEFNSDAVYRGFDLFEKSGISRWKLFGSTDVKTPWTISSGTLVVTSDKTLGASTETLTIDGGVLELDQNNFDPVKISRPILLTQNDRVNGISTDNDEAFITSSIAGEGSLSKLGDGMLILTNDNVYSGGTRIFSGGLKIGDGQAQGSIKGDIQIDKEALLMFDRKDTYRVDNTIKGDGGYLLFTGGGTAHFTQDNDTFQGTTEIDSAELALSGKLRGQIRMGADSILTGSGTAKAVISGGKLAPGDAENYGTFTITDEYYGLPGSVVHIRAELKDDRSQTDKLIIEGDSHGESTVHIENFGEGGDTINGIEIISVGGASNAEFTLKGHYELPSGAPAFIAGAHAYILEKGSDNPQDGNWYLRSKLTKNNDASGEVLYDVVAKDDLVDRNFGATQAVAAFQPSAPQSVNTGLVQVAAPAKAGALLGGNAGAGMFPPPPPPAAPQGGNSGAGMFPPPPPHATSQGGNPSVVQAAAPAPANAPQGGNLGGGQNVAPPLPPHGAPQGGNPGVQAAAPVAANAPQDGNTGAAQAAAPVPANAPQDGNTGAAQAAAPVPANAPQDGNSSATQATASSQRGARLSGNSRGDQDKEIYQPGVPLYSGLASIVHRLNGLAGLFERGADRYWRGAGAANVVEGDGPGTLTAASDPTRREMVTDAGLVWGRIETAHTNANLYESTTSNRYEMDSWKIRAGIDNQFLETEHGRLIGSAWFEYSNVKADLLSFFGNGRINVNGNALGTSLTWFGDNGLYLDAQAQALWTKSDISSSTLNRNLVNSVKGKGYALSVEAGQVYAINQAWTLIPNGQITWSQTSLDEFSDPFYAQVSFDRPQALTARGGVRIEYGQSWLDSQGFMNRGKLYGSTHLSHEFLGRNSGILVSQEKIKLGHEGRSWGELGLGGVYNFQNDKFSIFGESGFGGYLHDLAESYSLRGNLGFRVKW